MFRLRLRAWLSRPVLDVRIELEPKHPPTGYPWHAYYGARFAWRDDRVGPAPRRERAGDADDAHAAGVAGLRRGEARPTGDDDPDRRAAVPPAAGPANARRDPGPRGGAGRTCSTWDWPSTATTRCRRRSA